MILDALVHDMPARRKIPDAIGSTAEWRLKSGFANIALLAILIGTLPPFLRQNDKLANDSRQFAIARRVYGKRNLMVAGLFRLGDMAIIGRELRAIFFDRLERKNHVIRGDWRAIMPFCLLP